jgi:micrococcal nuclease
VAWGRLPVVSPTRWLAGVCLLAGGCGSPARLDARVVTTTAVVTRVVDGDTLVLRGRGRVRLIGVDAPETWVRRDCFGAEATRALRRLTPPGAAVRVAPDVRARDRYGRSLLYLWTSRGVFVNAALVRGGFARAVPVPPDTARAAVLDRAEAAARRAPAGLWRPAPYGCVPKVSRRAPVRPRR